MAIERTLSIVKPDAVSKTTSVKFLLVLKKRV